MRLVVKKYDKTNSLYAAETFDDGAMKVLHGPREVGARISVFIELMCDETETGADRACEALSWLQEEIKKRKKIWATSKAESATRRERAHR